MGKLKRLEVEDGRLLATVGRITVALPIDMMHELSSSIGERIGILRTDNIQKTFRWHVFPQEEVDEFAGATQKAVLALSARSKARAGQIA